MLSRLQANRTPAPSKEPVQRAALYTRVSTEMQVEAESLRTQEKQLRDYCGYHKVDIHELYTDAGLSGAHTENRPAFQRMMRDAAEGKFNVVIVAKIDRISRNLADLLELIHTLESIGVDFVSISQQFDTSVPMGRLTLNILGSFAQFERDIIAERTRENLLERAKRGERTGGVIPYGYKVVEEKFVIEADEAQHVRRMFREYARLRSFRAVGVLLNAAGARTRYKKAWSARGVKRTLMNPAYKGISQYNKRKSAGTSCVPRPEAEWIIVAGVFPVIIDEAQWDEVNRLIESRDGIHHSARSSAYLLTGIIRCAKCGAHMQGRKRTRQLRGGRSKSYVYYACGSRVAKGMGVCDHAMHRAEAVESKVVGALAGIAKDPSRVVDQARHLLGASERDVERMHVDHDDLSARVAEINDKLMRLAEAIEEGTFDRRDLGPRVRSLRSEREILNTRLEQISIKLTAIVGGGLDPEHLAERFDVFNDAYAALTITEKKLLLQNLVDHVVVHENGGVDIYIYLPVAQEAFALSGPEYLDALGDGRVPLTRLTVSGDPEPVRPMEKVGTIADRITYLRRRAGLTKKGLAQEIGANPCSIANWERRGLRPARVYARRMATLFDVSYAELMDIPSGEDDAEPWVKLRKLRQRLGYAQKEMAELVGLTLDVYVGRESGDGSRARLTEGEYERLSGLANQAT